MAIPAATGNSPSYNVCSFSHAISNEIFDGLPGHRTFLHFVKYDKRLTWFQNGMIMLLQSHEISSKLVKLSNNSRISFDTLLKSMSMYDSYSFFAKCSTTVDFPTRRAPSTEKAISHYRLNLGCSPRPSEDVPLPVLPATGQGL